MTSEKLLKHLFNLFLGLLALVTYQKYFGYHVNLVCAILLLAIWLIIGKEAIGAKFNPDWFKVKLRHKN